MICYGLATRFGKDPFKWHIPGTAFNVFFANRLAEAHKREITAFCDSEVNSGKLVRGLQRAGSGAKCREKILGLDA